MSLYKVRASKNPCSSPTRSDRGGMSSDSDSDPGEVVSDFDSESDPGEVIDAEESDPGEVIDAEESDSESENEPLATMYNPVTFVVETDDESEDVFFYYKNDDRRKCNNKDDVVSLEPIDPARPGFAVQALSGINTCYQESKEGITDTWDWVKSRGDPVTRMRVSERKRNAEEAGIGTSGFVDWTSAGGSK